MTERLDSTRRAFLRNTFGAGTVALAAPHLAPLAALADAPPKSGPFNVGIYTRPWDKFDYRVALDQIAEAGFRYAGLMTTTTPKGRLVISVDTTVDEARAIGREVKKRGLSVSSVYGGGIPVQKSLEAGIQGMRQLIDNCVAAGARSLLMGGIGRAELVQPYYKAIAECCDYAAEKKLPITVKPHGGMNSTGPQCRKCIEMVGHKNFSLWYDPGNIFFYSNGKLNPVDDAATVNGLVNVGMCIKDFYMPIKDGKPTRDVWITPGDGWVDFPKVLAALQRGGFTSGDLVIECVTRGDGSLPVILKQAKRARKFVEGLIRT